MTDEKTYQIPNKETRQTLADFTRNYIKSNYLTPPLSPKDVFSISEIILAETSISIDYKDYTSVLIGSLVWEKVLSNIPYNRRILLLPLCLRNSQNCAAEMDEFGLICMSCGNCELGKIQERAEELGYVVLIAEGTTVVTKLIESGQIEAVIGVGCLNSLERSFPYITKAAIPAIAIPLLKADCVDTEVDTDWLMELLEIKSISDSNFTFDYKKLRNEIDEWFTIENLKKFINISDTKTENIAIDWLSSGGKRWRPFLTVSTFQALQENFDIITDDIKKLAISVECFHKASLIHDDIEDDDSVRYDNQTLHEKYDISTAINIGDLLMGFGYRLIGETSLPLQLKSRIYFEISKAHSKLCIGQGEELNWLNTNHTISVEEVIKIFRHKTSPAFEVSMTIGAIAAACDDISYDALVKYNDALGIAYQIQDDIDDFEPDNPSHFSIINSLNNDINDIALSQCKAEELLEFYKNLALDSVSDIKNVTLKSHLFRLIFKILQESKKEQLPPAHHHLNQKVAG